MKLRPSLVKHIKRGNVGSFVFSIPIEVAYYKPENKKKANIMAELLLNELGSYPASQELKDLIKDAKERIISGTGHFKIERVLSKKKAVVTMMK